jgi:DnaJ family protein C protein 11
MPGVDADDYDDPEILDSPTKHNSQRYIEKKSADQSWDIRFSASPVSGISLISTYRRDVFSNTPDTPIRSRINNSGEYIGPDSAVMSSSKVRGVRLEVETAVNMWTGLHWTLRGTRAVGNFSRCGISVGAGNINGLVVSLFWSRLRQTISVPIMICPEQFVDHQAVVLAVGVPWVLYALVDFGLVRPLALRKRKQEIAKRKRQLRESVVKRRREAMESQNIMLALVQWKQEKEREDGGLVILRAEYGVKECKKQPQGEFANVTIALANLVEDQQLVLSRKLVKAQLTGFFDPAPLTRKVLRIRYLFKGKEHFVEFKDKEDVMIPLRSHET